MRWWLAILLLLPLASPAKNETITVRYVIDGDTAILQDERTVRFIGINAPELGRDGAPDQPLAVAARNRLRTLIEGHPVRLSFEKEQRDHYGRWLAHLILPDGIDAGEILVREGLACAVAIPPNIRDITRLQAAEQVARQQRRGLWGVDDYAPRPVAQITDSGFQLVRGRVHRIGTSRQYIFLDLEQHLTIRISKQDWHLYFTGRPQDWHGVEVEARGWVTRRDDQWSIRIGHPGMLRRLP